jgi:hypothetical protein
MKNFFLLLSLATVLISCGVKVPYTTQIRDEFTLDTDEKMRQVQFYTSHTIILNQEKRDDSQNTTQNGTLVASSNSVRESIVIPAMTECLFENFGPKGEVQVRFMQTEDMTADVLTKPLQGNLFYKHRSTLLNTIA